MKTWYDMTPGAQLKCAKNAHAYYEKYEDLCIGLATIANNPIAPLPQIARIPSRWNASNWLWYMREKERGSSFVWTNPLTTDEWAEQHADDLRKDIETHIEVMTGLQPEDVKGLSRLVMISVRQWDNFRRGEE